MYKKICVEKYLKGMMHQTYSSTAYFENYIQYISFLDSLITEHFFIDFIFILGQIAREYYSKIILAMKEHFSLIIFLF